MLTADLPSRYPETMDDPFVLSCMDLRASNLATEALFRLNRRLALFFLMLAAISPCFATSEKASQPTKFRWIHSASDAQLWKKVESAFQDELTPDEPAFGKDQLDVYKYKFIRRIGIIRNFAVVFIGHRPTKNLTKENDWDEYYSAFNFDIATHQKAKIENAEWMWKMDFGPTPTLGPSRAPDITIKYLSCTECEPEVIFASLQYDPDKSSWHVRSWGDGKEVWWATKEGLVVAMDVNDGSDTISFDCAYGLLNSKRTGFQDFAIRCKDVSYVESGKVKIDDSTFIYSTSRNSFGRRRVVDLSEIASLNKQTCRQSSQSVLCRLPFYLTATSGQNSVLDEMFPTAAKPIRDLACFRRLREGIAMNDVVKQCGRPDEIGGSGISIFIYHLDDGSLVTIGSADEKHPVLYATHIDRAGNSDWLIAAKQ